MCYESECLVCTDSPAWCSFGSVFEYHRPCSRHALHGGRVCEAHHAAFHCEGGDFFFPVRRPHKKFQRLPFEAHGLSVRLHLPSDIDVIADSYLSHILIFCVVNFIPQTLQLSLSFRPRRYSSYTHRWRARSDRSSSFPNAASRPFRYTLPR